MKEALCDFHKNELRLLCPTAVPFSDFLLVVASNMAVQTMLREFGPTGPGSQEEVDTVLDRRTPYCCSLSTEAIHQSIDQAYVWVVKMAESKVIGRA